MGKWTREKHEEVKARHADQGERGIDAQQVWDDLGEALVEIERGWAEIERLTELVAPVEAWAQRAADVVCAVPIDDLVRAGLASEDPAVTFEELEADHDLGSLRAAHERARAVILRAIAAESVPAPSAPAEMLAAQPSPEKDNQIKRLATLSVALISARAANKALEQSMQRLVAQRNELVSKTTGAPAIVVEPTEAEIAAERDRLLDTYGRARTTLPGLRGDAAGWLAVAEASLARARCPTPLTEAEAHRWGTKIIGDGSCGVRALAVFVGDALRALERGEIPPEVRPSKPSGEPGAKCSAFADGTWEADVGGIMLDPALTRHGDPHEAEWETRSWTPKPGDCVRTAEKLTACDSYALEARAKRRANASGKVIRAGDPGHGLYFDVRHDDGTKAPYDIDELRPDIDERLCVSVLVTNIDGHVALIESAKPGRGWELPGGGVKPGETPRAAALREVAEEIGVQLVEDALEPAGILRGTPKPGAEFTSVIHVFRARAEGKLRTGSDAREAGWWAAGTVLLLDRCGKLSDLASRDVLLAWARAGRWPVIDLQISARRVMERARGVLDTAMGKFARYSLNLPIALGVLLGDAGVAEEASDLEPSRPSVGAWCKTDGRWSLYDDRGVRVAQISRPFASNGIPQWHWYAARPYRSPARNQERTLEEAKAAVLAVLSTWADIGSVS